MIDDEWNPPYDQGGVISPGLTTVVNRSGEPEPVVPWVHFGQLGGAPVVIVPSWPETAIVYRRGVVMCGRLSHLQYTIALATARRGARRHLEQLLDDFAARWGLDRRTKSE